MSEICFVDTNVLVYARDSSEVEKQPLAHEWMRELWARRCGRTGVQVLNEYFVTVTQKLDPGLPEESAWADIEDLFVWEPVAVDPNLLSQARPLADRFGLAWWDALIVAAAQAGDCRYLLTEDLQDGQDLNGIEVVSPFKHRPDEILDSSR